MKILIITPLYPPDLASHAPYTKELATRLSKNHEVSILTYNHIPEAIPHVDIYAISKKLPTLIRIIYFTVALMRRARTYDIIYAQNGPSIELPLILTSYVTHTPIILRLGDAAALNAAKVHKSTARILTHSSSCAQTLVTHPDTSDEHLTFLSKKTPLISCTRPLSRPEISALHPSTHEIHANFDRYEKSWHDHITCLMEIFKNL